MPGRSRFCSPPEVVCSGESVVAVSDSANSSPNQHCPHRRICRNKESPAVSDCWGFCGGQSRDRTDDLPLFRRTLVPTELPGRKVPVDDEPKPLATLTGLEPATSAVTGRRANQLRHRALLNYLRGPRYRVPRRRTPYGIRTRATALKGRRPRPLDEGGRSCSPLGARIAYDRSRANHKSTGQTHKRSIATSSTTRTPRVTFAPFAHVVNSSTPRLAGALPL